MLALIAAGLTNALAVSAAILGVAALVVLLAPETQAARQAKVPSQHRGYPGQPDGYRPSPSRTGPQSRMAHRR